MGRDWGYMRDTEIRAYGWVDRGAVVIKHLVAAVELRLGFRHYFFFKRSV